MSTSTNALRNNPQASVRTALVFVFAVVPLTFPRIGILGFNLSGWIWLAELPLIALMVLSEPLHKSAARYIMPYLFFMLYAVVTLAWTQDFQRGLQTLTQLAVPALAYLLAWRAPEGIGIREKLPVISRWGLAIAMVLAVGGLVFPSSARFGFGPVSRPASLSLVVLFVVATLDSKSWFRTTLIGGLSLALTIAAGARAASVLLILMLITSPSLHVRWGGRMVVALTCLLLLFGATKTDAFQQRFFFNEDASVIDLLTLSGQVNTAGRRELWPELIRECSATDLTGLGIGASNRLSNKLSDGALDQPHNDYLRTYCEVGMFGTATFWAFFLWAGLRSWRGAFNCPDRLLHGAAAQLVLAMLLFAITDNPMLYTALFTVPIAVVLGLSDRSLVQCKRLASVASRSSADSVGTSNR